jgi:hypothetical protein
MEVWKFNAENHVLERIQERNPKCNPEDELNRIKQILKENIPDDWRLTRFSSDYLIRDLKTGITLVGYQTRIHNSTTIIKHITTALSVGGFSKGKLGKHAESPHAFDIAKRPNLFLGDMSISSIFEFSPVAARQYEKVFYRTLETTFEIGGYNFTRSIRVKSPREYLRLNPLKSLGIVHEHFMWMEWIAERGFCKFIRGNPPKDYHGEDFWILQVER